MLFAKTCFHRNDNLQFFLRHSWVRARQSALPAALRTAGRMGDSGAMGSRCNPRMRGARLDAGPRRPPCPRAPYRPRFTSLPLHRKNRKRAPRTASCCSRLVLIARIADLVVL